MLRVTVVDAQALPDRFRAVVFAVFTSYILSRTIVPVLVKYLLAGETHPPENATPHSFFGRIQQRFNNGFERVRSFYVNLLAWALGEAARTGRDEIGVTSGG